MSEFKPLHLNIPSLPSKTPKPAEPISWFKHIAPTLPDVPETEDSGTSTVTTQAEDGTAVVHKAVFGSVDLIAEREERRRRQGQPEPADIRKLRTDAAEEARRILNEAREQARRILEESREEGYRAGYAAGHSSGEREAARILTQRANDERAAVQQDMAVFMAYIEETSRRAWIEMEPEIISLVFEIARKVIKMEVEINHEAALSVVKNTLRRVADTTSLRIRVHADDLETVRANREYLYTLVDGMRQVEIVEDRRVGQGGCIVETDAGTIDARIETQMDEIYKLLQQTTTNRE